MAILLTIAFTIAPAQADDENPFEALVKDGATTVTDSIFGAFSEIFHTGVTGGQFHTAATHKALGFDLGVRTMLVMIPTGESAAFDTAEISMFPVPVAQASVGLPYELEVMARGFGVKFEDASVSLFGIGVKKNFKSFIPIPMFPDISAMVSYHKFKATYTTFTANDVRMALGEQPIQEYDATFDAGNLMNSTHWSIDIIASKRFSFLIMSIQPYLGVGYDASTIKYEWSLTETTPVVPNFALPMVVSGENKASGARLTMGLDFSPFPFVHIFGDYNIGKFNQATVGLAVSVR
ncbi:MAG: hypothetical protein C4524_02775 [Candidatus Zixiibacteriota bacterium]|nr:MAG: hypothetical protein C4524_02775 [candidate division Zixibacteria bacterium]